MAGAETQRGRGGSSRRSARRARRESHHEQARLGLARGPGHGGRGERHHEFSEVHLVQGDAVVGVVSCVCLRAELRADGDLGCEADDGDADAVCDEGAHGVVDVARVAGEQGAVDDEHLAGAVGGGVEERGAGHLEGVLEGRVALGVLRPEELELLDVLRGVAAHVADADGDAVAHADDAELRDGVLLEVFGDEFAGVAEREEVSCGTEVFLDHGEGEVEDEHEVADDSSLEGRCVS